MWRTSVMHICRTERNWKQKRRNLAKHLGHRWPSWELEHFLLSHIASCKLKLNLLSFQISLASSECRSYCFKYAVTRTLDWLQTAPRLSLLIGPMLSIMRATLSHARLLSISNLIVRSLSSFWDLQPRRINFDERNLFVSREILSDGFPISSF